MSAPTTYQELEQFYLEERRAHVIMFADMVDSTKVKEERFAYAMSVVITHNAIITEVVETALAERAEERGVEIDAVGAVVKYIGDEVMVSFAPEHADLAFRCAMRIQERFAADRAQHGGHVETKIGIAMGDAVSIHHGRPDTFDPHGQVVDLAARLVSIAQPGQILVDKGYRDGLQKLDVRAPAYFPTQVGEPKHLKGFSNAVEVSAILPDPGMETKILNLGGLRKECKLLEEALTEVLLHFEARDVEMALQDAADTEMEVDERRAAYARAKKTVDDLGHLRAGPIKKVRDVYAREAKEVKNIPSLSGKVDELFDSNDRLRTSLKGARVNIVSKDRDAAASALLPCSEELERFVATLIDLHILVDKWIRYADGSLDRIDEV